VTQPLFRERGSAEESPETPASPEAPVSERASVAAPNVLLGAAAHERSAADVWESMISAPRVAPMSLSAAPKAPLDVPDSRAQIETELDAAQAGERPQGTVLQRLAAAKGLLFDRFSFGPGEESIPTALRNAGIGVEFRTGSGCFFDDQAGKMVLDSTASVLEMADTMLFTYWARTSRFELSNRNEYVRDQIGKAARAATEVVEFNRVLEASLDTVSPETNKELRSYGVGVYKAPGQLAYTTAYLNAYTKTFLQEWPNQNRPGLMTAADLARAEAARAGGRAVTNLIVTGQILTAGTLQRYADYYGTQFDQKQAQLAQEKVELAKRQQEHRKAAARQAERDAALDALFELSRRVDADSPEADQVIELFELFRAVGELGDIHSQKARDEFDRLLGPFGYREVNGVDIHQLQWARIDYALSNYRRLTPEQRKDLRRNPLANSSKYGITNYFTEAELAAQDRVVAIRPLPDGTTHQGTLAEYRVAVENARIRHALGQIEAVRNSGPASLLGRIVGGEKGAALGGAVDSFLIVAAPIKAQRANRARMQGAEEGGYRAPMEPEAIRVRARAQPAAPTPDKPASDVLAAGGAMATLTPNPVWPQPTSPERGRIPATIRITQEAAAQQVTTTAEGDRKPNVEQAPPTAAPAAPSATATEAAAAPITRVKERLQAVLNGLPKNYDKEKMKQLRALYINAADVEKDLKNHKVEEIDANRAYQKIDKKLEEYATKDTRLRRLVLQASPGGKTTSSTRIRGKIPKAEGKAGVRLERSYNVIGSDEAIHQSKQGNQVYEYFDKRGRRLYVGLSGGKVGEDPNNWTDRLFKDHIRTEWILRAVRVRVTSGLSDQERHALETLWIPEAEANIRRGEYPTIAPAGDVGANAQAAMKYGTTAEFGIKILGP
jgi:hypothetical protein